MSSDLAKQYHSVIFGGKNTWDDWHLIPANRPVIVPPTPNMSEVAVPGMSGSIDTTELLAGYPTYSVRSGSIQFIVDLDYWPDWSTAYSTIMTYLHGKRMRMILDDDPGYFYEGRFAVNQWASGASYSTITINYSVHPYKQSINSTDEPWEWDPFSFVDGVIRQYAGITFTDTYTLTIVCDPEPSVPVIVVSDMTSETLTVEHKHGLALTGDLNGDLYTLAPGDNVFPDLKFTEGTNQLIFTGSATITVRYRGGRL